MRREYHLDPISDYLLITVTGRGGTQYACSAWASRSRDELDLIQQKIDNRAQLMLNRVAMMQHFRLWLK